MYPYAVEGGDVTPRETAVRLVTDAASRGDRTRWDAFVAKVREMDHPPGGPKTGSIGEFTPKLDRSGNQDEN